MGACRLLNAFCNRSGGELWVPEYVFAKPRRWRFDAACPLLLIAVEVEGGAFSRGRHTRGKGYVADMQKYNAAVVRGWRVLRYTPQQMDAGEFIDDVNALM